MISEQPIVAILLAAGAGSRFGGGKLVHPLNDGVALAAHAARNLKAADLEVYAVVRPGDFPVYDMLEQEGCHVSPCASAALGMGASLAHGVGEARQAAGWVIALADMPRIRPATIRSVAQALREGAPIALPRYRGTRGHPVGFGRSMLHELAALTGDAGARSVIERHAEAVVFIDCDDPGIAVDIDRPADLLRLE
jgi:molybdenum cofactor cytidylyltransferase